MRGKPKEHTQYWIYFHDPDGYNFETATDAKTAVRIAKEAVSVTGWARAEVWYGNEKGAFMDIDPYEIIVPEARSNPFSIDDFGFEDAGPAVETNLHRVEKIVGAIGSIHDARPVFKDSVAIDVTDGRYWYWYKQGAWFIDTNAANASQAAQVGRKIQKALVAWSKVPVSEPRLHDKVLYVGAADGSVVEVPPVR